MNEKRNVKLRDALLKALAIATFSAVSATAFTPVAQARVLLDEVNDGNCDLGANDTGDGTAADPYRISTVEDLAEVGDCDYDGTYYYSLENDLDITPDDNYTNDASVGPGPALETDWNTTLGGWLSIGEFHEESFGGVFDGNGHTISGLDIDNSVRSNALVGLFRSTEDAVIKDLSISGEIDADGAPNIGMLAGLDTDSQISNVHIDADITDGGDYVGGLIGVADGTRMSNITTTGDVTGIDYVGGVVGKTDSADYDPSLTDSSSDADVNNGVDADGDHDAIGGLIGEATYARILRGSFGGSVTGTEDVGGIAGNIDYGTVHNATVTEDVVIATTAESDADNIGGLVGDMESDSSISSSSFHGTIDANQNDYAVEDLGGIVGESDDSYILNVYTASTAVIEVTANGDVDSSSNDIGGIAGSIDETVVSGAAVYANITVTDAYSVGGIVGEIDNTQLESVINRGNVSVTLDDSYYDGEEAAVGGIVGDAGNGSTVTNSSNKGDVTVDGLSDTYGIGGIVGIGNFITVYDNYNTGDVTGADHVAGVVGMLTNNYAVVQRNFNLGKLTGTGVMDPDGIATLEEQELLADELSFDEPSNVVLVSDRADNETGASEFTAAELKDAAELVALGWLVGDVDRADWQVSVGFNSGYPHLAWETVSEDIDEEVGLQDITFEQIVTFLGGKRKVLRTAEKNALNEVAELMDVNAYDNVEVHVYYSKKVRLAQKRGLNVKRWLVRQGVAQTITVFVHQADNNNPVGSVTIEALVD